MSRELIRKLQEKRSRETAADLETKKNCTVMIPGVTSTSNLTPDQATRMFEEMVEKNPTRCVYMYENGSVVNNYEPESILALLSETTKLNRTFSGWKEFDYDAVTDAIIGNSKEISMKDFYAQFIEHCAEQGYPLLSIDTTKSKLVERKFEIVGRTLSEAKIKIQEEQELYWLFNTESEKVDAEQQMTDVEAKERNKSLKAGGEKTRWIKAEESREIKDAKLLESLTADDLQL